MPALFTEAAYKNKNLTTRLVWNLGEWSKGKLTFEKDMPWNFMVFTLHWRQFLFQIYLLLLIMDTTSQRTREIFTLRMHNIHVIPIQWLVYLVMRPIAQYPVLNYWISFDESNVESDLENVALLRPHGIFQGKKWIASGWNIKVPAFYLVKILFFLLKGNATAREACNREGEALWSCFK